MKSVRVWRANLHGKFKDHVVWFERRKEAEAAVKKWVREGGLKSSHVWHVDFPVRRFGIVEWLNQREG